jgi:hypothetical protein
MIGHGRIDATLEEEGDQLMPILNLTIYKVAEIEGDPLDFLSQPEWYYKIDIGSQDKDETMYNYNAKIECFGENNDSEMKWTSESVWVPEVTHSFEVNVDYEHTNVGIDMKLMEYDGPGLDGGFLEGNDSDLADISGFGGFGNYERGGKDDSISDFQPAMYECLYNIFYDEFWTIINNQYLVNKTDENGNWWNVTSGENEVDGSTETENEAGDSSQNDAEIWFKIEDSYAADLYKPIVYVQPTVSFNIGNDGGSGSIVIKNDAPEDPYLLSNLLEIEDVSTTNSWLTISQKTNEGLGPQSSHSVGLSVSKEKANEFSKGQNKTATITIKLNSIGRGEFGRAEELDDVTVQVTVTKSKAKSHIPNWQTFIENIFSNLPILKDIFYLFIDGLINNKL